MDNLPENTKARASDQAVPVPDWMNAGTCIDNMQIAYEDAIEVDPFEDGNPIPTDTVVNAGDLGVLIGLARYAVAHRTEAKIEPWPGYTVDAQTRRVVTLAKLGLMLSVMAGGDAPEVVGFDAGQLYDEVLMAFGIEDSEFPDLALEEARDHPDEHFLQGAADQGGVRDAGDEFNRGVLIAAATLINVWGHGTQTTHLLKMIDADVAMVERMQFTDYDHDPLIAALTGGQR